jgi:hypothetical protein
LVVSASSTPMPESQVPSGSGVESVVRPIVIRAPSWRSRTRRARGFLLPRGQSPLAGGAGKGPEKGWLQGRTGSLPPAFRPGGRRTCLGAARRSRPDQRHEPGSGGSRLCRADSRHSERSTRLRPDCRRTHRSCRRRRPATSGELEVETVHEGLMQLSSRPKAQVLVLAPRPHLGVRVAPAESPQQAGATLPDPLRVYRSFVEPHVRRGDTSGGTEAD